MDCGSVRSIINNRAMRVQQGPVQNLQNTRATLGGLQQGPVQNLQMRLGLDDAIQDFANNKARQIALYSFVTVICDSHSYAHLHVGPLCFCLHFLLW